MAEQATPNRWVLGPSPRGLTSKSRSIPNGRSIQGELYACRVVIRGVEPGAKGYELEGYQALPWPGWVLRRCAASWSDLQPPDGVAVDHEAIAQIDGTARQASLQVH